MKKSCDIATGELTHNGYIRIQRVVNGKRLKVRAHRESWEKHKGPIPPGMLVLHRCDNRACREITHLFLGTHQDNMNDCKEKGRTARGRRNVNARLTSNAVKDILSSPLTGKELAAIHRVSEATISKIRTGKIWKHVTRSD